MSFDDFEGIPVGRFLGLFDRGEDEQVPPNHALSVQNNKYGFNHVETREGSVIQYTKSSILRIGLYKKASGNRILVLISGGDLFDASVSLVTPIVSVGTAVDFSVVTMFDRAYISFHNRVNGVATGTEVLQVYDGTTCRDAGGTAPTGFTLGAATSATAGNVDAGKHLLCLAYETASGFITQPGPAAYTLYTASGGRKIDLSSIPTAPSGVSFIHVLSTRKIIQYTGRQEDYELFFVPGERFAPGSATRTINFYDNDLKSSAAYLFNVRPTIPCGTKLLDYKNRLVIVGLDGTTDQSIPIISVKNNPEQFNTIDNYVTVNPGDAGGGVKSAAIHRGNIYFQKSKRTYVTTAIDGIEPVSWPEPVLVDGAFGTEPFGISQVLDSDGNNLDIFLQADRMGLLIFDGSFAGRELTWKIEDVWKRINQVYFNTVQVVQDPVRQRIYVNVPLDAATTPNYCLVGDYSEGLNAEAIKWDIWKFAINPVAILMDVDSTTQKPIFKYASTNVLQMDETLHQDNGTAIETFYETGLLVPKSESDGVVNHFGAVRLRTKGSGSLGMVATGEDGVDSVTLVSLTLAASPGREYLRKFNLVNERCKIKFSMNNSTDWYKLIKVIVYGNHMWEDRPQ